MTKKLLESSYRSIKKELDDKRKENNFLTLVIVLTYGITLVSMIILCPNILDIKINYMIYCDNACYIYPKFKEGSRKLISNFTLYEECKFINQFHFYPFPYVDTSICSEKVSEFEKSSLDDFQKEYNGSNHFRDPKNDIPNQIWNEIRKGTTREVIDKDPDAYKHKQCLENRNCHLLEKCNEEYKCVRNEKKRPPERVCNEDGCNFDLNDGECFWDRHCDTYLCTYRHQYPICNEYYECECKD